MTDTIHFVIALIVICEFVAITGSTLEDVARDLASSFRRLILPSKETT